MMPTLRIAFMAMAVVAGGCVSTGDETARGPLLPDKALRWTSSFTTSLESLAGAALLYAVIDPLAPNWQIETQPLADRRYAVALTMKRFTTGGEGEAYQVFLREAERIARDGGAVDYRIAAFSEGIESQTLVARRVARGIIELR